MRHKILSFVCIAVLGSVTLAQAQTAPMGQSPLVPAAPVAGPCVIQPAEPTPPPKKKVAKRKKRKVPSQPPAKAPPKPAEPRVRITKVEQVCGCPEGDRGPEGPPGPPGERGPAGPPGTVGGGGLLNIGIGVMTGIYVPEKDYAWAWGLALQLRAPLNGRTDLTLSAGLAMGADGESWSPGRESGVMARLAITQWGKKRDWLAWTVGLSSQSMNGVLPNKEDGGYVGLTPGIALRKRWDSFTLHAEVTAFLGGSTYESSQSDWDFAVGLTGGAFLSKNW